MTRQDVGRFVFVATDHESDIRGQSALYNKRSPCLVAGGNNCGGRFVMRMIDKTGKRFGRWTVLERAENNSQGSTRWLCKCDCGTVRTVYSGSLSNGCSKSCGCLCREIVGKAHSLPPSVASANQLFARYRLGARKRGYAINLTKKQFLTLTKQNCHYCGVEPRQVRRANSASPYIYNGVDRVNNDKGYVLGNVVACCKICNHAKTNMPVEQFRAWIKRAYNHQKEQQIS